MNWKDSNNCLPQRSKLHLYGYHSNTGFNAITVKLDPIQLAQALGFSDNCLTRSWPYSFYSCLKSRHLLDYDSMRNFCPITDFIQKHFPRKARLSIVARWKPRKRQSTSKHWMLIFICNFVWQYNRLHAWIWFSTPPMWFFIIFSWIFWYSWWTKIPSKKRVTA